MLPSFLNSMHTNCVDHHEDRQSVTLPVTVSAPPGIFVATLGTSGNPLRRPVEKRPGKGLFLAWCTQSTEVVPVSWPRGKGICSARCSASRPTPEQRLRAGLRTQTAQTQEVFGRDDFCRVFLGGAKFTSRSASA